MSNYILDKINELGADGVDFIPLTLSFMEGDYLRCKIIRSYKKAEFESDDIAIPKTPYLFWKNIDGEKVYCK